MPRPPHPEGYWDKVNYVIDAWMSPCQAPWYVYIETLRPAALEGFITLLTFGWDDVFRGWARPKDVGRRRSSKRKGKWRRAIPTFPEVGEAVGRHIPGSEHVQRYSDPGLTKHLWRIDGFVQRGLFYWLIADVTVDLMVNWTSQLYAINWCQGLAGGGFSARRFGLSFVVAGNTNKVFYTVIDYNNLPFTWNGQEAFSGPFGGSMGASLQVFGAPIEGPVGPYVLEISNQETGLVYASTIESGRGTPGPEKVVVQALLPPNVFARVRFTSVDVSHWIGEGFVWSGAGAGWQKGG